MVFLRRKNATFLTRITCPRIGMIIGLGRWPGVNKSPTLTVWYIIDFTCDRAIGEGEKCSGRVNVRSLLVPGTPFCDFLQNGNP